MEEKKSTGQKLYLFMVNLIPTSATNRKRPASASFPGTPAFRSVGAFQALIYYFYEVTRSCTYSYQTQSSPTTRKGSSPPESNLPDFRTDTRGLTGNATKCSPEPTGLPCCWRQVRWRRSCFWRKAPKAASEASERGSTAGGEKARPTPLLAPRPSRPRRMKSRHPGARAGGCGG